MIGYLEVFKEDLEDLDTWLKCVIGEDFTDFCEKTYYPELRTFADGDWKYNDDDMCKRDNKGKKIIKLRFELKDSDKQFAFSGCFDDFGIVGEDGERYRYNPKTGEMDYATKLWCALVRNANRYLLIEGKPCDRQEGICINGKTYRQSLVDFYKGYNRNYYQSQIDEKEILLASLRTSLIGVDTDSKREYLKNRIDKVERELAELKNGLIRANMNIDKQAEEIDSLADEDVKEWLANGGEIIEGDRISYEQ